MRKVTLLTLLALVPLIATAQVGPGTPRLTPSNAPLGYYATEAALIAAWPASNLPTTGGATAYTGDKGPEYWDGAAWQKYGTGSGSGTVTSVGLTAPSWLTVAGSPVTSAGTLAVTAASAQTQNQVIASPNGSNGPVALRALAAADIPALAYATSVAFTDASATPIFTITGSPVTSSGTLTETLATQLANLVFAGPASGGAAQPVFRLLVATDIPQLTATQMPAFTGGDVASSAGSVNLTIGAGAVTLAKMANETANTMLGNNTGAGATPIALTAAQIKTFLAIASTDVSGLGALATQSTAAVANGGTNITSYAVGDTLYASASGVLSKLADVTAGSYLRSGGVTTAPLWSTLILPNAATTGDLLTATGTNAIGSVADVANGQLLVSGGVGALPAYQTLSSASVAHTVDVQAFTSTGTWTKPAGSPLSVRIVLIGGGGAGGGGSSVTLGTAVSGGGGGGGGMCVDITAPASAYGATETVTVGAAVTGANGATNSAALAGSNGSVGNVSSFGTSVYFFANAGGGGAGGQVAATNSGGGGGGGSNTSGGSSTNATAGTAGSPGGGAGGSGAIGTGIATGGAGGAGGSQAAAGNAGGISFLCGAGGASGGGLNTTTAFAGGNGGRSNAANATVTGGAATGATGANGVSPTEYAAGSGGAGGGGNVGGAGGIGGNGGRGAGGAGGGAASGAAGGNGGNGGAGYAVVTTSY